MVSSAPTRRSFTDAFRERLQWLQVQAAAQGTVLSFGRHRVVLGSRSLLRDGYNVELGARAFDLLTCLVLARGTIVPKEAILGFVWPYTFIDESNLRFQVACLRKALGTDGARIKTIPGRGYFFAAEVPDALALMHCAPAA